ncbi:MAG: hypothetical protein KA190_17835 [Kofleriaceae bacterium]|nr:hypothetical protein [Kofleriaceae bacterium]
MIDSTHRHTPLRPLVALSLIAALLAPGCATTRTGKTVAVASGVGLALAGGLVLADLSGGKEGSTERDLNTLGCLLGGCLLGYGAIIAGGALAIGALATPTLDDAPALAPLPGQVTGPQATAPAVAAPPAPAPPPSLLRPLPEVATDAVTLQLAKQVRSQVLGLRCEAAATTLRAIAARDPAYHRALLGSTVVVGCT